MRDHRLLWMIGCVLCAQIALPCARGQCVPAAPAADTTPTTEEAKAAQERSDWSAERLKTFEAAMSGMRFNDLAHYTTYFKSVGGLAPNQPIPERDMEFYLRFMPPQIRQTYLPGDQKTKVAAANRKLFLEHNGGTEAEWELAMAPDIPEPPKPGWLSRLGIRSSEPPPEPPRPEEPKPGSDAYCREAVNWLMLNSPGTNFNAAKIRAALVDGSVLMIGKKPGGGRVVALAKDQAAVERYEKDGFKAWKAPFVYAEPVAKPADDGQAARQQQMARKKVAQFQAKNGMYQILPTGEVVFMMPSLLESKWPFPFGVKYAFIGLGALLGLMVILRVILLIRRIAAKVK